MFAFTGRQLFEYILQESFLFPFQKWFERLKHGLDGGSLSLMSGSNSSFSSLFQPFAPLRVYIPGAVIAALNRHL